MDGSAILLHMTEPAWTSQDLKSSPHEAADKARRVEQMFAAIAKSYDLNNRVHSMWQDQAWRRKTVKLAKLQPGATVLDVACGTGDLSEAFLKNGAGRVVGVDFTENMLRVAVHKKDKLVSGGKVMDALSYQVGDAMRLPLADASVDAVTIAFGIRNVTLPEVAIQEFYRVLKPGGCVCILEFSLPRNRLLCGLYNFYFKHIMPWTATIIARDKSGAYKYLPMSVNTFIDREAMVRKMADAGFESIKPTAMTFGVAICYRGEKLPSSA
ncbi:bifunctional demethylmenaquinone methyltransferase/2-methoxy-6-polyprenyl-1,4-benzoquinol methylase UbiE [Poriferisphaera sp. WC338]|uniref:bifunctional demethylmenaquinone methyltransferase/2-methoxy-6-polyprenyl-1,4-benzoquinol methylase UbiE n=1 Tax=Poriferisphaera sp. WC338 TaxID=3425129 RepID=UPI003D8194BE